MTITLFVDPQDVEKFIQTVNWIQDIDITNVKGELFDGINFTEKTISDYTRVNVSVETYLKIKYAITRYKKNG
jgi:hypothetical protein